jgi:hypothetical protein
MEELQMEKAAKLNYHMNKGNPLLVDSHFIGALQQGGVGVLEALPFDSSVNPEKYILEDIYFSRRNPTAKQLSEDVLSGIKEGDYLAIRGTLLSANQYVFAVYTLKED